MDRLLIGFIFSFIIAFAGYIRDSLSFSGGISAIILGTALYYFGGIFFSAILVAFFISSSILTKFKKEYKKSLADINEKGGRRDYIQVAANGLLGLVYAFLFFITQSKVFILAYASVFASSNADTWASEVGVLSKSDPISILSFKKIERGMSGGISLLGTIASALGAVFIGVIFLAGYIYLYGVDTDWFKLFIICSICGFLGSLVDSLIGVILQAKYKCSICNKITEKKVHHGNITTYISGISGVNNDVVNFVSGFIASIIAMLIYLYI